MPRSCDHPFVHTRRGVLLGFLLVATQAGCAWGPSCPDIEWPRTVVIRLADDWTVDGGLTAVPVCPDDLQCDGLPPDAVNRPDGALTDGAARLVLPELLDEIGVQVRGTDEEVLAATEAQLDWVRVGGTEACGGPMEAELVVPAP
jgi:hypothetical protein